MKAQPLPRDLLSETDLFVAYSPEISARAAPLGAQQVMLVPGQVVPVLALDLPEALRGQAREQVARHQLQDMTGLAPDVLEMRPFVTGSRDGWQAALVAERADVALWRQHAGKARAVLPDYLALPAAADLWVLEWTGAAGGVENTAATAEAEKDTTTSGHLRARLGVGDGFTAEADLAALLLKQALADPSRAARPAAVFSVTPLAQMPEVVLAPLQAAGLALHDDVQAMAAAGLGAPKRLAHGELALDLRRDPYQARTRLRRTLRAAVAPLLAGFLAATLWVTDVQLERRALERETAALEQAMLAQLRAGLLPEGPIFDVRRQVTQALSRHAAASAADVSANAPLVLLAGVSEVLVAQGATVERFQYLGAETSGTGQSLGQTGGQIRTEMRLPDFAAAEAVQADLQTAGFVLLNAESRSAEEALGGVVLELVITAAPQNGGMQDG